MAASLSTSSGSALIALSIVQACSVSCIVRTPDGVTIKKATGVIETPAPEPPPNISLLALAPTSEPPEAKPKVTRETGMMVVSASTLMGSPMMVEESTISRTLSIVMPIIP